MSEHDDRDQRPHEQPTEQQPGQSAEPPTTWLPAGGPAAEPTRVLPAAQQPPPRAGYATFSAPAEVLAAGDGRRPGRGRRVIAGAALATGLAVGGAALANAATSTPTPSPSSPGAQGQQGHGNGMGKGLGGFGRMRGHGLRGGPMMGLGAAVHGEATVKKADGGYQQVAFQHGSVTKVSSSSITVKSDDGFTATYDVTSDTLVNATRDGIGSVKTGHKVNVIATVSGSRKTAVHIGDRTLMKDRMGEWRGGPGAPGGNDGDGPATPPSSGSTSGSTSGTSFDGGVSFF